MLKADEYQGMAEMIRDQLGDGIDDPDLLRNLFISVASDAAVAVRALQEAGGMMDYVGDATFGCTNNCEGCQHEMMEASRIIHDALEGVETAPADIPHNLTGHEGFE